MSPQAQIMLMSLNCNILTMYLVKQVCFSFSLVCLFSKYKYILFEVLITRYLSFIPI